MVQRVVLFLLLNLMTIPLRVCFAPEDSGKEYIKAYKAMLREQEFNRFTEAMKASESPEWTSVNAIGCMGCFQFAPGTLKFLGHGSITPARFKQDPSIFDYEMQLKLFRALLSYNEFYLKDYIAEYSGKLVGGILITKSGILAGAHLGGAEGMKAFLNSMGKVNYSDMYGTRIGDYVKKFSGYEI